MRAAFALLVFLAGCSVKNSNVSSTATPERSLQSKCQSISWKVLGPFLASPNEGFVDQLTEYGGEENIQPDENQIFTSELVTGSRLHWVQLSSVTDKDGLNFKNAQWDLFQKAHGTSGVMATIYFYGELEASEETNALLHVEDIVSLQINGQAYMGQPYNYGFFNIPVTFMSGKNRILLKSTGIGAPEFKFECNPTATVSIADDLILPDLLSGEKNKVVMAAGAFNASREWIENLKWRVLENDKVMMNADFRFALAPHSVSKEKIEFELTADSSEVVRNFNLQVLDERNQVLTSKLFALRQVDKSKSRKVTFVSPTDQSVQYFSVVPPKEGPKRENYQLIESLHGANVEATDAVPSIAAKDWAYVIFPTNRRPHGFGWQGLGAIDALEAAETALRMWPIDRHQIYLSGHSMGGQGTWHLATTRPGFFAGYAPSAAWISFETYIPEFFQKLKTLGRSDLISFFGRALDASNHLKYLQNLNGRPVAITHAERDENVPPAHSRLMLKELERLQNPVSYTEAASAEHWCREPQKPDQGFYCVDHASIYDFLSSHRAENPTDFKIHTLDLSEGNEFFWIRILAQNKIMTPTFLNARIEKDVLHINTQNVSAFQVIEEKIPTKKIQKIIWNGKSRDFSAEPIATGVLEKKFQNRLASYGTMKTIFHAPAAIVVGTKGSAADTNSLLHLAGQISQRIWAVANASAPIFLDSKIPDNIRATRNLILLGGSERNLLTERIVPKLPFANTPEFKNLMPNAKNKSVLVSLWPSPWAKTKNLLIVSGANASNEAGAIQFLPLIERRMVNQFDFLILSPKMKTMGWAGLLAAGYFSNSYDLKNRDFVVLPENLF